MPGLTLERYNQLGREGGRDASERTGSTLPESGERQTRALTSSATVGTTPATSPESGHSQSLQAHSDHSVKTICRNVTTEVEPNGGSSGETSPPHELITTGNMTLGCFRGACQQLHHLLCARSGSQKPTGVTQLGTGGQNSPPAPKLSILPTSLPQPAF